MMIGWLLLLQVLLSCVVCDVDFIDLLYVDILDNALDLVREADGPTDSVMTGRLLSAEGGIIADSPIDASMDQVRKRQARKFEQGKEQYEQGNEQYGTTNSEVTVNVDEVVAEGSAEEASIYLSDGFFSNGTIPTYNNKFFLVKSGVPRRLPPAAWCSREVMAVAVPASTRDHTLNTAGPFSKAGWSSWTTGRRFAAADQVPYANCSGRLEEGFFEAETATYDAWVGEAAFDTCGGFSVETEEYRFYINVFRAPGPKNNVIVTCACPLPRVDYEYCAATARWEFATNAVDMWEEVEVSVDDTADEDGHKAGAGGARGDEGRIVRREVDPTGRALAGGFPLSVAATSGEANEVNVLLNQNGRVVFESHVYGGEAFYPWPWECMVTCSAHHHIPGGCEQPLIVGGCPVTDKLEFEVLSPVQVKNSDTAAEPVTQPAGETAFEDGGGKNERARGSRRASTTPGAIIFSMRSFVFEGDIEEFGEPQPMHFSCQMRLMDHPPAVEDFCAQKVISAVGEHVEVTEGTAGTDTGTENIAEEEVQPRPRPRQDWHVSLDDVPPAAVAEGLAEGATRRLLARMLMSSSWSGGGDSSSFMTHFDHMGAEDVGAGEFERFEGVGGDASAREGGPIFAEVKNDIVWDDWHVLWRRDQLEDETQVGVGNWFGYVDVTDFKMHGGKAVMTGWRDVIVDAFVEDHGERYGAAVRKGDYGVAVSRDNPSFATGVNVIMRGVEVGTLSDVLDRDYGARVKVRAFDLSVRHDFDEYLYQDSKELATEVRFIWKGINIVSGSDIVDTHYQVSVTVHGVRMSVLRDFDERQTSFSGNWGNGWKLVLSGDWADYKSDEIYGAVGFGQQGRAYVSVGAGITSDGMPQGHAEVQATDFGLDVDFVESKDGDMLFGYAITVGKFTYVWDSIILPENIRVPVLALPGGGRAEAETR